MEQLVVDNLRDEPLFIGISGCQGSGKTTLTNKAAKALNDRGITTIAISIDDFCLPHADQVALAKKGNPMWQRRGLFGSHDVQLMFKVLSDLKAGRATAAPIYDKAQFGGQGDRVGQRQIDANNQAVLLEGWSLGFRPVGKQAIEAALANPDYKAVKLYSLQHLCEIDDALQAYLPVWNLADILVYMRPANLEYVYLWRLQQEHGLRASNGTGMTDDEVKRFVDMYMPAYELYRDTVQPDVSFLLEFDRSFTRIST